MLQKKHMRLMLTWNEVSNVITLKVAISEIIPKTTSTTYASNCAGLTNMLSELGGTVAHICA